MRQQQNVSDKGTKQNPWRTGDVEIGNPPKKEFKVMIVKMIKEFGRKMDTQSNKPEFFKKQSENNKKTTKKRRRIQLR